MKKNANLVSCGLFLVILLNIMFFFPMKAYSFSEIQVGNYMQFGTYDNNPILWRVINIDEDGDPLLFSEYVLCFKAFDSYGEKHENKARKHNGSNYWSDSNIRQWLNSDDDRIDWIQNEPSSSNILNEFSGYNTEKGFLSDKNYTKKEINAIKEVKHKVLLSSVDRNNKDGGNQSWNGGPYRGNLENGIGNYDLAYYENVNDKVFLLSIKELKEYVCDRGYSIFMKERPENENEERHLGDLWFPFYWLRTYSLSFDFIYGNITDEDVVTGISKSKISAIDESGSFSSDLFWDNSARGSGGVRPALYLNADMIRIDNGTGGLGDPYVIARQSQPSNWAKDYIESARVSGLTKDHSLVDYQEDISREEFCELVINSYELLSDKNLETPLEKKFTDTNNPSVLKANKLGIVNGLNENIFSPYSSITREQIAVMLNNLLDSLNIVPETTMEYVHFNDEDEISSWAKSSVQLLNKIGIISGVGNDMINPKGYVTNEQAIVLIVRFYEEYEDIYHD